jgi:S-DNA-T family DNA segregation ATPase FtsK/SpoIIIE
VLALYADLLGFAGHYTRLAGYRAFGWGVDVLPVALVLGGCVLLAHRARRGMAGLIVALVFLLVCSAALGELAGNPHHRSAWRALEGAGGAVGAYVGGNLRSFLGPIGAGVVLGAVAALAICPLVGASPPDAALAIGRVFRYAGRTLGAGVGAARERREAELTRREAEAEAQADAHAKALADARAAAAPDGSHGAPLARDAAIVDLTEEIDSVGLDGTGPGPQHGETVPAAALPAGEMPVIDQTPPAPPAEPPNRGPAPAWSDAVASEKGEQLSLPIPPLGKRWQLPPLRLLARSTRAAYDRAEIESRGRVLERALAAHGVETRLVGFTVGPTVTRFELELGPGVKVARVTSLAKDIAYAMASPDVRILAPIPGRSAIGVEVPNVNRELVTLGDVLATNEARRADHPLEVPLGRDIAGRAVMVNLAEMPHLLIAGATGAGKSSCINSIVTSVLMRSTPDRVRLILVDPKRVELGKYNQLPHLLAQVVVNPKRAANALSWAVAEMERRYDLLAEAGMRDITGYNAAFDRGEFAPDPRLAPRPGQAAIETTAEAAGPGATGVDAEAEGEDKPEPQPGREPDLDGDEPPPAAAERLPYILIVIDELNDLMMVAARDVEESICRLAQMARAVGIHLVIATQRPSVDVITGVIKANIPSRLAFSVSSLADSRVILDQPGAERLVGRGDLLLLTASSSIPRRIQGPWVTEQEVAAVVGHWRRQSAPSYVRGVEGDDPAGSGEAGAAGDDDDELFKAAMELVVRSQLGSTSMLQRKLRVGFARAGRLMDLLERRGVVGPSEGSKARAVLMTPDELDELDRA